VHIKSSSPNFTGLINKFSKSNQQVSIQKQKQAPKSQDLEIDGKDRPMSSLLKTTSSTNQQKLKEEKKRIMVTRLHLQSFENQHRRSMQSIGDVWCARVSTSCFMKHPFLTLLDLSPEVSARFRTYREIFPKNQRSTSSNQNIQAIRSKS
jgi:hypothetical protein